MRIAETVNDDAKLRLQSYFLTFDAAKLRYSKEGSECWDRFEPFL